MTSCSPSARWYASDSCSTRWICSCLSRNSSWNSKKPKSSDAGGEAVLLEQLLGALLADDRELHQVGDAVRRQRLGQLADQVVDQVAAPVVERPVGGDLLERVDGGLEEARDDQVVGLLGDPWEEVDGGGRHAVCDAVAECVRQRVGDGARVEVDRVHVLGAVARELDGLQAAAAADVEAALSGSDLLAEQVAPDEEAALRRHEHARLEDQVREREREQVATGAVGPALGGLRPRRPRGGVRKRRPCAAAGPAACRPSAALRGRDVLRADAAAAADDLRALGAPPQRHLGVFRAADVVVEAPAGVRQVAEVGIDAERHVGEVAQPAAASRRRGRAGCS